MAPPKRPLGGIQKSLESTAEREIKSKKSSFLEDLEKCTELLQTAEARLPLDQLSSMPYLEACINHCSATIAYSKHEESTNMVAQRILTGTLARALLYSVSYRDPEAETCVGMLLRWAAEQLGEEHNARMEEDSSLAAMIEASLILDATEQRALSTAAAAKTVYGLKPTSKREEMCQKFDSAILSKSFSETNNAFSSEETNKNESPKISSKEVDDNNLAMMLNNTDDKECGFVCNSVVNKVDDPYFNTKSEKKEPNVLNNNNSQSDNEELLRLVNDCPLPDSPNSSLVDSVQKLSEENSGEKNPFKNLEEDINLECDENYVDAKNNAISDEEYGNEKSIEIYKILECEDAIFNSIAVPLELENFVDEIDVTDLVHFAMFLHRTRLRRASEDWCTFEAKIWERMPAFCYRGMRDFELANTLLAFASRVAVSENCVENKDDSDELKLKIKNSLQEAKKNLDRAIILLDGLCGVGDSELSLDCVYLSLGECHVNSAVIFELQDDKLYAEEVEHHYIESVRCFDAARQINPNSLDEETVENLREIADGLSKKSKKKENNRE